VTPIPHLLDAPMAADLDNGHHQDDATYVGQPVNVTCWRQAASVSARHAWSLASFDPNGITHRYPPAWVNPLLSQFKGRISSTLR
jgi:hypothetical protein